MTCWPSPARAPRILDRVRAEWGLDRSWPVQYLAFAKNVFTGELGKSFNYQMPVSTLYFQRLPNSLELALGRDADLVLHRHPGAASSRPVQGQQRAGTMSARSSPCSGCRCPASGSGW